MSGHKWKHAGGCERCGKVWEMWEGVREGGCGGGYSVELGPIILCLDTSGSMQVSVGGVGMCAGHG